MDEEYEGYLPAAFIGLLLLAEYSAMGDMGMAFICIGITLIPLIQIIRTTLQ